MFACGHIFYHYLSFLHLCLSDDGHERNLLCVGITHLFLHLRRVRIDLCTDTCFSQLGNDRKTVLCLFFTEVHEKYLGGIHGFLWIEVELVEHIEDAVSTKRDTYTRQTWHTEDAGEVIVTATTCDATDLYIECLHFEDGACIVVQSTSQGEVEFNLVLQSKIGKGIQDELSLLDSFQSCLAVFQHLAHRLQLLCIRTCEVDDGLQFLDGIGRNSVFSQFCIHVFDTDFVQFIDGYRDIYDLICLTYHLSNSCEDLTVVDFDTYPYSELREYRIDNLHQLHLVQQRIRSYHICITLIELSVATLLRTVGTPYGLNLIALEWQRQFLTMHHHIAGKRYGKIISQTFLAELTSQFRSVTTQEFFVSQFFEVIA